MAAAGRRRVRRDRGITLMELLLVVMLLVILGSLAIPAITNAFASVRLRRAGDAIISRWAEARAQAIETGQIYQFRFTPDTGRYRLEPWVASAVGATSAATTTTATATAPSGPGVAVMPGTMPGVGSSRVDLQACKLEYSIVSPK